MVFLKRVASYLFKYPGLFWFNLGLAITATLFALAIPRIVMWVIDDVVKAEDLGLFLGAIGIVAICYAGQEIFNGLRIRTNNTLEQKVLIDLRKDLHAKLLVLPVSFYDRRKSGEVASRVTEDVQSLERALLDGSEQGTVAVLMIVGIAAMLFTTDPFLATFVLLPVPMLIALAVWHFKFTRKNWKRVREEAGQLNSLVVEDIQGNRLIQSFGLREREHGRFMAQAFKLRDATLKAMYRWSIQSPVFNFTSSLGTLAVIGIGGWMLFTGKEGFTAGAFVAFVMYSERLVNPIRQLNGLNHMLSAAKASGERVFEVLDEIEEVQNPAEPKPFPSGLLEVKYTDVAFAYAERSAVLENLNMTLPAGKVTALVGHTGAGKSTIANLLLRYYDVTGGSVTINGRDVREMDLEDLRTSLGYVAQDPFLFDGTVAENLLLAKQGASEAEIRSALESARAWDFVSKLPDGMHTLIGERGIRLSMGEKQRLTIARVLLRNPPLIILDEATASVDSVTERYIQEALDELMHDRTVLVIAHRLSTIRKADQIICLDHGKILECGGHDELLAQNGQYARLWRTQHDLLDEVAMAG